MVQDLLMGMETYQGTMPQYYSTMTKVHYPSTLNVSNGYFASTTDYDDDVARPISENVASCSHYLDNDLNYETMVLNCLLKS